MTWQAGDQVGPYEILAQLGQGGMATVYKAYHAQLDRHVAIKVMHQTFMADTTFVTRFKREAQIVARLEHPHIVPVYDYNDSEDQPYLVMKYVPGLTLKQRMFKNPLTLDEILYVMGAVGSALTYAHHKGVLHRDVKPSNIVIDQDNIPYLADFGLARIAASGESTLSADVLLGTPNYISPEQAGGKKDLDGRTDIYSFGIVLYELLVGQVPFTGDTPYAVIHDHIYKPIPEPSKINPEIPLSVEAVLLKATAKLPEDRYSSADEVMNDLKAAVDEGRLARLSVDRSSIAGASLAKLREEFVAPSPGGQRTLTLTPTPSLPQASTGTASSFRKATIYQPRRGGRVWMLGGCGAFILISMIGIGVLLGAWNNILEFGELMNSSSLSHPGGEFTVAGADSPFAGLPVYALPPVPVEVARAFTRAEEPDAWMNLAAANAFWQNNPQQSYDAVIAGKSASEDPVAYLITAADLANRYDDFDAAAVYTVLALYEAEKTPTMYTHIRPAAGKYLYDVAGSLTLIAADSTGLEVAGDMYSAAELQTINGSAPRFFLTARAMLLQGNERLANTVARRTGDETGFRAEITLLQGEIAAAQNRMSSALTLWQSIADQNAAPDWVKERAAALIAENSAQPDN